jgi:hypothetical protein
MSLQPNGLDRVRASTYDVQGSAMLGSLLRRLESGGHPGLGAIPDYTTLTIQSPDSPRKGLIDSFVKICQRWHLSISQQIVLLGYKGSDFMGKEILAGHLLASPQDIQDRTGYVLAISVGLGALFNESEAAELAWLTARREALNGLSALSFILEGRMANLMIVLEIVNRERGL